MMNSYRIVYIDLNEKRAFVTYSLLKPKTEYEKRQMETVQKTIKGNFQQAGEDFANYELVDITEWEYDSFEALLGKMIKYNPSEEQKNHSEVVQSAK